MKQYLDLMRHAYENGVEKSDRTGIGTRSIFGHQMRFDLSQGFPIVTTKKVHFKSVVAELLWFLSGSTRVQDLRDMGCTIWDEWQKEDGTIGPMYGFQWREWWGADNGPFDQIEALVEGLRKEPDSRRHIVSAWNVADLPDMALAPCHAMFQCYVANGKLSLQPYQRSADIFLGVPFNIASYALLTNMLAQQTGLDVGEFIWTGGDCHLYSNHLEQTELQLSREPRALPKLVIKRKPDSIFDYKMDDFELVGYDPHPAIKGEVAV